MLGFVCAVSAGCCAAIASTCSKLAMSPELLHHFLCECLLRYINNIGVLFHSCCPTIVTIARLAFFFMVFFFNAVMWTLFVKSLRGFSSSAQATITNTGSTFICTAFLGRLLFGETVTLRWWLGTSLILSGLILIHINSTSRTEGKDHVKTE